MSRPKRAQSTTSRTVAMVAVVVLVAIAIAGVALARRPASSTTPDDAVAMTEGAASGAAPAPSDPNELVFADGSDQLTEGAKAKLAAIAQKMQPHRKTMVIVVRVPVIDADDPLMALGRKRADAIRNELLTQHVDVASILTRISRVGTDPSAVQSANRIRLDEQ